jgi:hypothetical protein
VAAVGRSPQWVGDHAQLNLAKFGYRSEEESIRILKPTYIIWRFGKKIFL